MTNKNVLAQLNEGCVLNQKEKHLPNHERSFQDQEKNNACDMLLLPVFALPGK